MSGRLVEVVELAAWGLEPCSSHASAAPAPPIRRDPPAQPLLAQSPEIKAAFLALGNRQDLLEEFGGLAWSLEMVDLRSLLAFQRRLSLDPERAPRPLPGSFADLLALAFGPVRELTHRRIDEVTIQSENPDLQLRPIANGWRLHGGSPFMEVTLFGDRAFLRDGYHRAYDLLGADIYAVPAVVIRVGTPEEICPADSWFMPYDVLLGLNSPRVIDFLDPALTITYKRPRLLKTIHLTVTESMEPER